MPPVRWLLMFTILVVEDVKGASVAEEINFEVSNMRELAKNNSQVRELERLEYDQEDSNNRNESDDPELAASEIVETHVLPEEPPTEEINAQMKRPRRRRRRRRRKRPKPTLNPEDVESYYNAPEEESKRKPMKYRLPETNDETPQEASNLPKRRNIKRRRRPHKRPVTDDVVPTVEEISEQTNNTKNESQRELNHNEQTSNQDEQNPYQLVDNNDNKFNLQDSLEETTPHSSRAQQLEPIPKVQLLPTNTNGPSVPEKEETEDTKLFKEEAVVEVDYDQGENQHSEQNHNAKIFLNKENRILKTSASNANYKSSLPDENSNRASNTAFVFSKLASHEEEETTVAPRRQKRPPLKTKNTTEIDTEEHKNELLDVETKSYNLLKPDNKSSTTEPTNSKTDNLFKVRDGGKRDSFKIRRLPPTTAILRQIKIRPLKKNETQNRIEEHFTSNNEIISFNETTTVRSEPHSPIRFLHHSPTNVPDEEDNAHSPSEKVVTEEDNFESLVMKHVTEPSLRSASFSSTTSMTTTTTTSTTSSTTENTAFIYIPCNRTLNEVLKHNITLTSNKFNKRTNSTTRSESVIPQKNPTHDEAAEVFKSVAMEELEKLLKHVKTEVVPTASSTVGTPKYTNISRNNTKHIYDETNDSSETELLQNYRSRNHSPPKTRFFQPSIDVDLPDSHNREPKWYQDYTKVQRDSKERKYENSNLKLPTTDKDFVLLYTSTSNPNFVYNDVDSDEYSLHIRNNTFPRKHNQESLVYRSKIHTERKKLPLAVKSAIIISGAILALAVLGFFALLLSCKIRQAKSRMKCHRELYRENFHNSEFRQSSRSTSPVVSKSNYNGRSFVNNMQPNIAPNRNYYLWQTLRKTFQYD